MHALLTALALLLFGSSAHIPAAAPDGTRNFESEVRALVKAARYEEALALAVEGLEYAPESVALLDLAGQAAAELERDDEAVWYWGIASDAAAAAKVADPRAKELAARLALRRPAGGEGDLALAGQAAKLFELADLARSKKLYANAVDLLLGCRGTPAEARAEERLETLYANEAAVAALLASGLDVPARPLHRKTAAWIAREDKKHSSWKEAYEFKGDNYTVRTDMGYEIGQSIALAMEQMNAFYRQVFQYKQRGGNMARCKIFVYRSREEFDQFEGSRDPGVKGFFVPGENRVATYDPKSEGGAGLPLFSTLFHEASHQFTHAISDHQIPGWLNEGTASYFEGAALRTSGQIAANLIPEHRLQSLVPLLQRKQPTLKQVVSYFEPGSYGGEYYPFGWGLVYFMHNYEDERCERVYLEPYRAFLASYKSGEAHDPFERFIEYFVEGPAQAGIASFEDFAKRFEAWIRELHGLHFGKADKAEIWLTRAREQRGHAKLEAALASYGRALDKRPGDREALFERAQVLDELGRADAAIYAYRGALARERASESQAPAEGEAPTVAATCLERIRALEPSFGAALIAAEAGLVESVLAAASAWAEAGYPRHALRTLATAQQLSGGDARLAARAQELRRAHPLEIRRWRRIELDADLAGWSGDPGWRSVDGGAGGFECEPTGLAVLSCTEELAPGTRYEVAFETDGGGEPSSAGLVFGTGDEEDGLLVLALDAGGGTRLYALRGGLEPLVGLRPGELRPSGPQRLAVEISGSRSEFFLNGRTIGSRAWPAGTPASRIGVFAQGCRAHFSALRWLR